MVKYAKEILIVILVAIIIIQRECNTHTREQLNVTELHPSDIKIVHEYTPISLDYHIPNVKNMVDTITIHDTQTIIVTDTLAVVKDYLIAHVYYDTIYQGKQGQITLIDTVQFNRIINRKKIINLTPIIPAKKRELYTGLGIGGNPNNFGFSGRLLYRDRKRKIYGMEYDFVNRTISFSMYWKIGK